MRLLLFAMRLAPQSANKTGTRMTRIRRILADQEKTSPVRRIRGVPHAIL
jgi:hypothetical protein